MSVGKVSYILRQAHDAYIEYRVGLSQDRLNHWSRQQHHLWLKIWMEIGRKTLFPFSFLYFIIENRIRVGKAKIGCESGMYEYSKTDKYGCKDD